MPAQGEWCTVITSIPVGREYRTQAARAYRIGDTMWMEEAPGFLEPWVRAN